MTGLSEDILRDWQVRKSKTQKTRFIAFLQEKIPGLRVEEGGTIENTPAYARPRGSKWFAEWSADNTQLNLVYRDGFHILVR